MPNHVDPNLTRDQFEYELPPELIAQSAIEPRDASRLLVAEGLTDHYFRDLSLLLDPGDLLVVNETKVRHARLRGRREGSGGMVELLVLEPLADGTWECLCRPARRLRIGSLLEFGELVGCVVGGPIDGRVRVEFTTPGDTDVEEWIEKVGEVPLPPYFHGTLADPGRYQTQFAGPVGSAAAPTASLHFTRAVLDGLEQRGVAIAKVELRVGLDTFRPMTAEHLADHEMHSERFRVPAESAVSIADTRARGGRVIAVGTTVARALEACATDDGTVGAGTGSTDLFIVPGYRFRVLDRLITNFHVPGSTLLALVAAVLGDRWRDIYSTAIDRRYRFLSFGDAMLLDVPRERGK